MVEFLEGKGLGEIKEKLEGNQILFRSSISSDFSFSISYAGIL